MQTANNINRGAESEKYAYGKLLPVGFSHIDSYGMHLLVYYRVASTSFYYHVQVY